MRTTVNYRRIWEKHHCKSVPEEWHIHHLDGDSHNNDVSNLHACHFTEHAKIHAEQGQPWIANWILGSGEYDMSGENHPMWNKTHSDDTKTKMALAKTGPNNPHWGTHLSDETKAKLSKANLGKTLTDGHKAKISKANIGRVDSDVVRANKSKATAGRRNPNANPEVLHLIDSMGKVHSGTRVELRNNIGISSTGLTSLTLGSQKSHNGWRMYIWKD